MELLDWLEDQTTNKSSFIRETLLMRMMGMIGAVFQNHEMKSENKFDADEVKRMIQI
jgi:hypothetical protein